MKIFSILCALFLFSAPTLASFTLSSTAFDNNAPLPLMYSGKDRTSPLPLPGKIRRRGRNPML